MFAKQRPVGHASNPCRQSARRFLTHFTGPPTAAILALGVVTMLTISMVLGAGISMAAVQTSPQPGALFYASTTLAHPDGAALSNVSYCEVLGQNPGNASDLPPQYEPNISKLWYNLCVRGDFTSTIDSWGNLTWTNATDVSQGYWAAKNLSIGGYNISYHNGTGNPWVPVPTANFVVGWAAPCANLTLGPNGSKCPFEENWKGNVSTYAITGPYLSEAVCGCVRNGSGYHLGPSSAPNSGSSPPWIFAAGAAAAIALLVVLLAVRRANRPPEPPVEVRPSSRVSEQSGLGDFGGTTHLDRTPPAGNDPTNPAQGGDPLHDVL
jgi:hypothetical protein